MDKLALWVDHCIRSSKPLRTTPLFGYKLHQEYRNPIPIETSQQYPARLARALSIKKRTDSALGTSLQLAHVRSPPNFAYLSSQRENAVGARIKTQEDENRQRPKKADSSLQYVTSLQTC